MILLYVSGTLLFQMNTLRLIVPDKASCHWSLKSKMIKSNKWKIWLNLFSRINSIWLMKIRCLLKKEEDWCNNKLNNFNSSNNNRVIFSKHLLVLKEILLQPCKIRVSWSSKLMTLHKLTNNSNFVSAHFNTSKALKRRLWKTNTRNKMRSVTVEESSIMLEKILMQVLWRLLQAVNGINREQRPKDIHKRVLFLTITFLWDNQETGTHQLNLFKQANLLHPC